MKKEVGRRAPLLEEVWIQNFNKLFLQEEEKADQSTRIRYDEKVIDLGFLFPNLKSLNMSLCDNITVLLSPSSARCLMCLEKLSLANCKNLKNIISDHDDEKIELEAKNTNENNKITFPKLQHLFLIGLPNFKAFCQGPYHLDFPSLEKVEVEDCPNIELFSKGSSDTHMLEEVKINDRHYTQKMKKDINTIIQEYKTLVALQKSEMLPWTKLGDKGIVGWIVKESTMEIESFDSLSMLFPLNEIQILLHVRKLFVRNCASLVELFESTKEKEDTLSSTTLHTQVEEINLWDLPKLSHIWKHTKEVVGFQKVRNIEIIGCHNLRSLFSCSMAKRLVNLQVLVVQSCDMLEKIVVRNKEEDDDEDEEESSKLIVKIYFSKLEVLELSALPKLECFGLGGDYNDFDIPFCDDGGDDQEINIDKVQIVFPKLKRLSLFDVPSLRCFYSGEYDYDIMVSSSMDDEQWYTFFHGNNNNNVILSTPSLSKLHWFEKNSMDTLGDLNLTIHYLVHSEKYRYELRKLKTLRDIEQDEQLAGYIKRERELHIEKCHKLKHCIPSNKMHLFSHVGRLYVLECECLKEIFEESSSTNARNINVDYGISSSGLGLKNLHTIKIRKCHDLRYVLRDVSMVKSLPNLSCLKVDECNKMEQIIGRNNNSFISEEAKIIFPFLKDIHLSKLPSLRCFGQSGFPCYVEMPRCSHLRIYDCPLMNTFWYNGTLYTPELYSLWVEGRRYSIYDEINEILSFQKNNPSSME